MKAKSFLFLFLSVFLFSCSSDQKANEANEATEITLGKLEHGFDLSPVTKEKFEEGLLLLHNFEYEDALTVFKEATALDSNEVMTHWGEAMCHYKALWKLQNTNDGLDILLRLGETKEERLAKIDDPIKKAMWELVEIMYGEGEFEERNEKIKTHLGAMHNKYPKQQEIAAFYALSLIWATEEYGDGSPDLRLAATIADKITEMNPAHPGALHYKIHALDGPTSAKDALDAANVYAKVAADAAHALHMPSHIYLAIGEWNGVVNSNQKSYDASVDRMVKKELKDGARGYHSLSWLHYGLLQKGQYNKAEAILNDMINYVPKDPTKGARLYLLGMQSRQLAESGKLNKNTQLNLDIDIDDLNISTKSVRSLLRAQIAYQNNDTNTIKEEIEWLSSKIYVDSVNIKKDGNALCAAGNSRYAPTENTVRIAQVNKLKMQGLLGLLEEDTDAFEKRMRKAVELENLTDFPTGPPSITKPSFEQYGEWLLEKGRYQEANKLFDQALERMPKRAKSLKGKYAALKGLNQTEEIKTIQDELKSILTGADAGVSEFLKG